jgi:threonine dehydrogenase-like Zn-dependent dehydrogenase
MAVASGATVIATSSSDDKLKIAAKLGAKHLINYKTTPDWDQEVLRITHGRGVDHIIEVCWHLFIEYQSVDWQSWQVGGPGTLQKSFASARFAGSINIIGVLAQVGNVECYSYNQL